MTYQMKGALTFWGAIFAIVSLVCFPAAAAFGAMALLPPLGIALIGACAIAYEYFGGSKAYGHGTHDHTRESYKEHKRR